MTTTWDPLHGGDPFPADPGRVRAYGNGVTTTGQLIGEQVTLLRKLQQEDSWHTEAADAFREKAEELADKIDKTKGRYVDTGAALTTFADTLDGLEEQAVVKRDRARELEATIGANPEVETPTGPGPDGTPPPSLTPEQEAQNRRRGDALDDLAQVQRDFDGLVRSGEDAARSCASAIEDATDDDVKDDWWDRNAGWIKQVTQILGWIALAFVLIALTVASGGTIWLVFAAVLTTISLLLNVGLALKADGSWWAVAIDAFSLLTMGTAGALTRVMSKSLAAVRPGVAAIRGQQAFAATMGRAFGIPRAIYSFAASVPIRAISRFGVSGISRMSDDAARAADVAFDSVMATRTSNVAQRWLLGGDSTVVNLVTTRQLLAGLRSGGGAVPAELIGGLTQASRAGTGAVAAHLAGTGSDAFSKATGLTHPLEAVGRPLIRLVDDLLP